MRILVFSDTHGNYDKVIEIIKNIKDVDMCIHCGDMARDCMEIKYELPDLNFYYVCGNNEYRNDIPNEISIEADGKKIFVTHGHLYRVRSTHDELKQKINEGYDLVLYGHTHIPTTEYYKNGTILNPGNMKYGLNNSYAVIEIEDGKLKTAILSA